mgnify:CR=1 FL=1
MSARPGPLNLITDVGGLLVGSAHDAAVGTGVTVIRPEARAVAAVVVAGGGPGTRETDALAMDTLVDAIDAIVFSGGSVYGLAAADGVTAALGAKREGYALVHNEAVPVSPIVPAAILFDLGVGDPKIRPDAAAGYQACQAASAALRARPGDQAADVGGQHHHVEAGMPLGKEQAQVNVWPQRQPHSQLVHWRQPFSQPLLPSHPQPHSQRQGQSWGQASDAGREQGQAGQTVHGIGELHALEGVGAQHCCCAAVRRSNMSHTRSTRTRSADGSSRPAACSARTS